MGRRALCQSKENLTFMVENARKGNHTEVRNLSTRILLIGGGEKARLEE